MYEVWQTGVSARLSSHDTLREAALAEEKASGKFRRSPNYNPGSLIDFEVRRSDGEPLSPEERGELTEVRRYLHETPPKHRR